MGIKKADGQRLHVVKQIFADFVQRPCGKLHHHPVVDVCGDRTRQIDQQHKADDVQQLCKIRILLSDQGFNVYVDDILHHVGADGTDQCADDDADGDDDQLHFAPA